MKTNHNISIVYSTFLLILSTSCTKTDFSDIPLVSVDVSKGQVCYLEDIAENIECYNLEGFFQDFCVLLSPKPKQN